METKYDACVIGCGEIGSAVLADLSRKNGSLKLIGYDVSKKAQENWFMGHASPPWPQVVTNEIPPAKVYFICVWTMDAVLEVLSDHMVKNYSELVFLETTVDPTRYADLQKAVSDGGYWHKLVLFPHRFNPGDNEHHIFNLDRLIGGIDQYATLDALNWLTKHNIMEEKYLHVVDPKVAVMSKVVENAYRAWEIILAQELKKSCNSIGMDFDALRRAVNTKWNIDIREARDGVKGKCLPKDLGLFNKTFPSNTASQMLYLLNEQFIKDNDNNKH